MNDFCIICFLSLVRTRTIATTAKDLMVTKQAVTRNLEKIEASLGTALFFKDRHPLELTWAGRQFLEWCQEYDLTRADLHYSNSSLSKKREEVLRLGWHDITGCPESLEWAIRLYREMNPGTKMEFRQGNSMECVYFLEHRITDILFMPELMAFTLADLGTDLKGAIFSEPLFREQMYIAIAQDSPWTSGAHDTRELINYTRLDLENTAIVADSESQKPTGMELIIPFGSHRSVPNVHTLYSEIANGAGYAVVPMCGWIRNNPNIFCYPLPEYSFPIIACSRSEHMDAADEFLRFLRKGGLTG